MNDADLIRRLDALDRRIERLERHAGLETKPEAGAGARADVPLEAERDVFAKPRVEAERDVFARPPTQAKPLEAVQTTEAQGETSAASPADTLEAPDPDTAVIIGTVAASNAAARASSADASVAGGIGKSESRSWERTIGERWLAWVGAIVVVLAVGFFVKMAYDLGWWGRIPPAGRCLLCAGLGVILLGVGEAALRRFGGQAAVGLYSAGLGTLYLTAYASFRVYELISPTAAFWLMFVVACLGIGVTVRSGLRTTGVLSLLGGYLSPILLADQETFPAALPLYVTALLIIGLSLSVLSPGRFRLLRYVTVAFHVVIATLWTLNEGTAHWLLAMSFLTGWWALVNAEAFVAAVRGQSLRGNCIVSFALTGWYTAMGCDVLAVGRSGGGDWLGVFAGAVAAVCTWWALGTGVGVAMLRRTPRRAIELFVTTLWVQVGLLLAGAIALHFRAEGESFGQTIGWLAMFAACVELGRRLPSRGVTLFGLLVGGLSLVRLFVIDPHLGALRAGSLTFSDVRIDRWAVLALVSVAVWQAAAWRIHLVSLSRGRWLPAALSAISLLQYVAVAAHCCTGRWLTLAWVLAVVPMVALVRQGRRLRYPELATVTLALVSVRWLLADGLVARFARGWDATAMPVVANAHLGLAVVIAGLAGWLGYQLARSGSADGAARWRLFQQDAQLVAEWIALAASLLLLIAVGFEADRFIGRLELSHLGGVGAVWPAALLRLLAVTLLAGFGGLILATVGYRKSATSFQITGSGLVVLGVLTWLGGATVMWRMSHGAVATWPIVNWQAGTGVALGIVLAVVWWKWWHVGARSAERRRQDVVNESRIMIVLLAAIGLWLGSFEIDRVFAGAWIDAGAGGMARQASLSVFWALYAIGMIAVGFWRNLRTARYAGLAMLLAVLAKVFIVDLSGLEAMYRVASFLVVGLLLLGTSLLYARRARSERDGGRRSMAAN